MKMMPKGYYDQTQYTLVHNDYLAKLQRRSDAGAANQPPSTPAVVTQGADHHEPPTRGPKSHSSSLTSDAVVDLRAMGVHELRMLRLAIEREICERGAVVDGRDVP